MNKVVGISVSATEMKTRHTLEIEVEFEEPCTQFVAQNIVLDAIGDLYTAGYVIYGQYQANKTGHRHNNELLKLLFANSENYQII